MVSDRNQYAKRLQKQEPPSRVIKLSAEESKEAFAGLVEQPGPITIGTKRDGKGVHIDLVRSARDPWPTPDMSDFLDYNLALYQVLKDRSIDALEFGFIAID